jgi:hypothetical protein
MMSMLLPVLSLLMACGSGIDIRVQNASVDVTAKSVPTSAVLDCLAEKLEIKVVYLDGDPPSKPLNLDLKGQTVRQAIEQVLLESQLNYALGADKSGSGIKTIVITGKKGPGGGAMPAQPTPYMDPNAGQEIPQAESTPEPSDPPPSAPVPYPGQPGNVPPVAVVPQQPGYSPYPGAPGYTTPMNNGAAGYPTAVPGSAAPAPAYPGAPIPTAATGYSSPGMSTPTPGYSSPGVPSASTPTPMPGYPTPTPGYPAPPPMSSGAYPAPPSASGTR